MKLPIKKKWFDKIKAGEKDIEYRDAHITFVCDETGETLRREVECAFVMESKNLAKEVLDSGCIEDEKVISFYLSEAIE